MKNLLIKVALWILRVCRYDPPVIVRTSEKIVEKTVEKPVDRIVEKIVPVETVIEKVVTSPPEIKLVEKIIEAPPKVTVVEKIVDRLFGKPVDWHVNFSDEEKAALDRAKGLCTYHDDASAKFSGEFRRHQVYARLIKDFPGVKKHRLGLLIEIAMSELRVE